MANSQVIKITGENWKTDVLEATLPVVVDFWAEWCGPCKMLAPVLDELSLEMADKVKIAKVNVDENGIWLLSLIFVPSRACSFSRVARSRARWLGL